MAALSTVGAFALAATLFASPARADGRGDHDGDADRDSSTSYTEDTDTNDGGTPNNVADAGDDRHPSGKDRSVEGGSGGNQGRSESDPDDDGHGPDRSNGGPDKPNGAGGVDLADQDGNNGCGNDDDFEDDNEGWCGHKPSGAGAVDQAEPASSRHGWGTVSDRFEAPAEVETTSQSANGATVTVGAPNAVGEFLAMGVGQPTDGAVVTGPASSSSAATVLSAELVATNAASASRTGDTGVLGALAGVAAAILAFTGDHIMLLMVGALLALALGVAFTRTSRRALRAQGL